MKNEIKTNVVVCSETKSGENLFSTENDLYKAIRLVVDGDVCDDNTSDIMFEITSSDEKKEHKFLSSLLDKKICIKMEIID